jgi:transposase
MIAVDSNDLGDRLAAASLSARSCHALAEIFRMSVASVVKWTQRYRSTGEAAARRMAGHRKPILEPGRALVLERLTADPDRTIPPLRAQLAAEWTESNRITLWRQACS